LAAGGCGGGAAGLAAGFAPGFAPGGGACFFCSSRFFCSSGDTGAAWANICAFAWDLTRAAATGCCKVVVDKVAVDNVAAQAEAKGPSAMVAVRALQASKIDLSDVILVHLPEGRIGLQR
jgi:hypothetical protein